VFLLPVDPDSETDQRELVNLMRTRLARRGTDTPANIERRAQDVLDEIPASSAFTHRLVNPAGEDDVAEWGEFGTQDGVPGERAIRKIEGLGPNARWLVETFVKIARGELAPGTYRRDE
jgi:hypothetical protein